MPDNDNSSEEPIDKQDFSTLLYAILRQGVDDYIKLQHPKFRNKKYLKEAFQSSVDMFFDSEFKFLHIQDGFGENISLKELVQEILSDDRFDLMKIQEHVVEEARTFWETKLIRAIYIPDSFIYDGHVYDIKHHDDGDPLIDFEQKTILINKDDNSDNEVQFMQTVMQIVLYHEDIPMNLNKIEILGKAMYRMLKINSCFSGA